MDLISKIPLGKSALPISYDSRCVLLGSCFTENIGHKLEYFQFRQLTNPFGIIYHPWAINNLIKRAASGTDFTDKDLFYSEETWKCFEVHSCMNRTSATEMITVLNEALLRLQIGIKQATHVVITLGTAFVYWHRERASYVANCHKIPAAEFVKKCSTDEDTRRYLLGIEAELYKMNPEIQILFTISPVRHLKDGFVQNQRSKATLIAALHKHLESSEASYFPAYEIVLDELRDYRFYDRDLVHPNSLAVDYIWERFADSQIDPDIHSVMTEVDQVRKAMQHRPFNTETKAYKAFTSDLERKIDYLMERYPFMKFPR